MNGFNARRNLTMLFVQPKGIKAGRLRVLILSITLSTGLFACSNLKEAQSPGTSTTSATGTYIQDKQTEVNSDRDIEAYQWFY